MSTNGDRLVSREEAAEILGIANHTLACWRSQGRGPACVKLGTGRSAAIRYRLSAIEAFLSDPAGVEAGDEPWRVARRQAGAGRRDERSTRPRSRPVRRPAVKRRRAAAAV
jgi:hypothetical protein